MQEGEVVEGHIPVREAVVAHIRLGAEEAAAGR